MDYQEPCSYKEAVAENDSHKWIQAINEELGSLTKNQTWVLVDKLRNYIYESTRGPQYFFMEGYGMFTQDPLWFKTKPKTMV